MDREKRAALILSAIIGVILLICTAASQVIYWKLLPRVREVEAVWTEEGALLPTDALYHGMHGTCIYVVEQREGRFGIKYVVKEVPVDVVREDTASQKVVLQGIYNPEWIYAAGAEGQLKDGIEVKVMN